MRLHQEDPILTAYLLGELSPEEARKVEQAAEADLALRDVLKETASISDGLRALLGKEDAGLTLIQRKNIRRAAKEAARQGKIEYLASHRIGKGRRLIALAAAAALVASLFVMQMVPSPRGGGAGGAGSAGSASAVNQKVGAAKEGSMIDFPKEAGKRSLAQITRAIRMEDRKPMINEVRVGELLNEFPLKAKGLAALWKGCALSAEVLPCPWRPSGNLILVSVQGAKVGDREISLKFISSDGQTTVRQLVGGTGDRSNGDRIGTKVVAGETVVFMIEAASDSEGLGSLTWKVNGSEAPPVNLAFDASSEPSEDASFAILISAFGLWLRGEGKPMIDDLMVLALAREAASENLVADRYDFIALVDQAMKLSGR